MAMASVELDRWGDDGDEAEAGAGPNSVRGFGDAARDELTSTSELLPTSLVLSAMEMSNGDHLLGFFFFLNVYLNGPSDSKLIGPETVASLSLRLSFLPPRTW